MEEIVKENLKFDREICKKILLFYERKSFFLWVPYYLSFGIFLILAGLFILAYSRDIPNKVFGAFAVFIGVRYLYTKFAFVNRQLNKLQHFHERHAHKSTFKMTNDGLFIIKRNKEKFIKWQSYRKAYIDEDFLLIGKYGGLFFSRWFTANNYTVEEFETLRSWIKDKIPTTEV